MSASGVTGASEVICRITLKKSLIGRRRAHIAGVRTLGLRRLHHSVERVSNPQVEGILKRVGYLLNVERITRPCT